MVSKHLFMEIYNYPFFFLFGCALNGANKCKYLVECNIQCWIIYVLGTFGVSSLSLKFISKTFIETFGPFF
jgi:hypothetical protein